MGLLGGGKGGSFFIRSDGFLDYLFVFVFLFPFPFLLLLLTSPYFILYLCCLFRFLSVPVSVPVSVSVPFHFLAYHVKQHAKHAKNKS